MAPMGVSPPAGLTNHGGVEARGLLCARCGGLLIFACPEERRYFEYTPASEVGRPDCACARGRR
eukprot:4200862-Prymnesium_polylepis.1